MIRVYARENASQRGNSGTALAGSVASAVRFIAKAILTGSDLALLISTEQASLEATRGHLMGEKGVGREIIVEFLDGVPGINDNTVRQQLANLKSSGEYANIIKSVQEEIERENKEVSRWRCAF